MNKLAIVVLLAAAVSTPVFAKKKPAVTGLELQQIQSRDIEVSKTIAFPAVMSVLQDAGYRIGSADRDTGLITGTGSSKNNITWMPFVGFGGSKKNPVVSAFIEDRGPNMTRIRLNFVLAKVTTNQFGGGGDETPITEASIYQDAFEKINQAIFVRQALDTMPATSAISLATTAQPTSVSPGSPITRVQSAPLSPATPK